MMWVMINSAQHLLANSSVSISSNSLNKMTVQDDSPTKMSAVSDILSQAPSIAACYLRPHPVCCLFISWNGCIVLVYDGFPPPLVQAKTRIASNNNAALHENFGSKWPKTTLGAVTDDADELSEEQFTRLKNICQRYSKQIIDASVSSRNMSRRNEIKVTALSIVDYKQRGLERLNERIDLPLDDSTMKEESVNSTPSEEEQSRVNIVISEWNDVQAYLPKVNAPGSRIGSYRQVSRGFTCVAFIDSSLPKHLRDVLSEFRGAVDEEFPGRYGWLDDTSLHCTLRSLDSLDTDAKG